MPGVGEVLDLTMSSSSDDEEQLSQRRVRVHLEDHGGSDSDSDDADVEQILAQPGTETDDEQDTKQIVEVEYGPGEQKPVDKNELKELLIQDLKTEDPKQPGGYALRRVGRGSVVLVRGEDPDGETVTWVALVNKVFRDAKQAGAPKVELTWFCRKPDVVAEVKAPPQLSDDPRQLLFSDMHDTVEAKFIRHRAKAWFLPPGEPLPHMRCGQGLFRHTRLRPGFIVRNVFDSKRKRVCGINDAGLARCSSQLAEEVERLIQRTRWQLERLQKEEAAYDEQEQLTEVDAAPLLRPEERAAAEAALRAPEEDAEEREGEEEGGEELSSSSSSDSDEEEGLAEEEEEEEAERVGAKGQRAAAPMASATEEQRQQRLRRREEEEAGRRAVAEQQRALRVQEDEERQAAMGELRRQQQQAAVDADAAKLAQLLPQRPPGAALQEGVAAAEAAAAAGGAAAGAPQATGSTSPSGSASLGWKRCAQQLLRQAGSLPKRSAAPPGKTPGPGSAAAAAAGSLSAAEVEGMVEGPVLPSSQLMAAVCRAICHATEPAARDLLDQLMFLRVLITWLWHLVSFQLPETQALEVVNCAELVLQALERCPYTAAADRWITLAQGHNLTKVLAANPQQRYPPTVQRGAVQLRAVWRDSAAQLRRQQRERQRQKEEAKRREADRDREGRRLLQQSPQAAKAVGIATSAQRLSALGGGGGLPYVKARQSPQPASLRASASPAPAAAYVPTAPAPLAPALAAQKLEQRLSLPPRPSQEVPAAPAAAPERQAAVAAGRQQRTQAPPAQQQQQQPQPPKQQQLPEKQPPPKQQQAAPPRAPQQPASRASADPLSAAWRSAFGADKGPPAAVQRHQQQVQQVPTRLLSARSGELAAASHPADAEAQKQPLAAGPAAAPAWPAAAGQKRPAPAAEGGGGSVEVRAGKVAKREVRAEAAVHAQPPAKAKSKNSKLQAMLKKQHRY